MKQALPLHIGLPARPMMPNYNHGRPDGMSVYTRKLQDELQLLGQRVSLWSFDNVSGSTDNELFVNPLGRSFGACASLSMLHREWARVRPPVDLYHATDYRSVPMSCAVVSTLFDAIPLVHPEMANPRLRWLKNLVLKNAAKCADHVIAISHYSVRELVEYYEIAPEKISVVWCGVDTHWLDPISEESWQSTLVSRGIRPGYFLFVGIIQPRKNLDRLMLAHDQLPPDMRLEHPLVIVGRPGWQCEETLKRLIQKIDLGESYWFSDVHSQSELKNLYAGAAAFVFPSLYEGFGLPILEAFAIGIPVVTSTYTSLPEVSAGIGFEVDPLDIDAMRHAMVKSLETSEREPRIRAGKIRAKELSWKRCAIETLGVYHRVMTGRKNNHV